MWELDGPKVMRFAWRIGAYDGMVARRVQAQSSPPPPATPATQQRRPATPAASPLQAASDMKPFAAFAFSHPELFEIARVPQLNS